MSDNRDLPEKYNRDDDVPFKLPKEEDVQNQGIIPNQADLGRPNPPPADIITGDFEVISPSVPEAAPPPAALPDHSDNADDTDELVIVDGKPVLDDDPDDDNDDDLPFRLPRNDEIAPQKEGRYINKMMTMPHTPADDAQTLAGSGGLDPNPDFAVRRQPAPTVQTPRVQVGAPTVQHTPDDRFRRPTQPQQTVPSPAVAHHSAPPPPGMMHPGQNALPPRRPTEKRRFRGGCLAILAGLLLTFCGGLTCVTSIVGVIAYARIGDLLDENIAKFEAYDAFQSTFIYDRTGRQLYEVFNAGRRTKVSLADIPQHLINATIATEDGSFYSNIGIDIPATTVAFLGYIGVNRTTAGGSTITQQLVRNVLFDPQKRAERSAARKAEEIFLAVALNARKSKDEILELYLNEIYYGNLAYGVEAAAQVFFGKAAKDLTLGEAALLAGLPQAPADLDPLNPDPAVQQLVENRWRTVLNAMVGDNFITAAQRDEALRQGLNFTTTSNIELKAPHFTVYAQAQLEQLMNSLGYGAEDIARGGLRVYTSVDLRLNDQVQATVRDQIDKLRANNVGNGAVVVIKPVTGEILAMVGSKDYYDDNIDGRVNVVTAGRQPGSTMKIFTYAAALEGHMTTGDVLWDTRIRISAPGQPPYDPVNYDRSFHGPMTMRHALANSYNIPAVQTLRHYVGVEYLLQYAQRIGINSLGDDASRYGLSLTLGSGEMSALELTRAYAVYGNQGRLVQTQAILCVLDSANRIIYQYEESCPQGTQTDNTINRSRVVSQVIDPRIAFVISDILGDNAARSAAMGSNSPLHTPGIISAVKTGTTDDSKDNWTVGYTRNVAVGVWVGNTRGEPMVNSSGLTGAAPIWNSVLNQIYANNEFLGQFADHGQLLNDQMEPPQGVSLRRICDVRTLIDPSPQCGSSRNEWFLDSPAGLPAGDGTLYYPEAQPQTFQEPTTGDYIVPADPGIYRVLVQPIPEAVAAGIQFDVTGINPPPPPRYCRVTVEQRPYAPGAQELLFILPPQDPNDSIEAEHYARRAGLAFMPTIQCSQELLTGNFGGEYGPIVATALITSPQPGEAVPYGGMPIIGTVQFDQNHAQYYKLEIRGGQFGDWTTIGDVHYENNIVNGQLEMLPGAPGLAPGNYELRLIIIARDASTLQQPYVVPFVVTP